MPCFVSFSLLTLSHVHDYIPFQHTTSKMQDMVALLNTSPGHDDSLIEEAIAGDLEARSEVIAPAKRVTDSLFALLAQREEVRIVDVKNVQIAVDVLIERCQSSKRMLDSMIRYVQSFPRCTSTDVVIEFIASGDVTTSGSDDQCKTIAKHSQASVSSILSATANLSRPVYWSCVHASLHSTASLPKPRLACTVGMTTRHPALMLALRSVVLNSYCE